MGFLEFGHKLDEVAKDFFPFLQKFSGFPNKHFDDQVPNGFGLDVVADKFQVVFVRVENKVEKLNCET
jgi:hypothetical protein